MRVDRWLGAAELAADVLVEHWRFLYGHQRSGRRAHNRRIFERLQNTSEAQLAAALALVHTMIWLLLDQPESD